jgi:transposase InsO family protein
MAAMLKAEGLEVNRKRVQRLTRKMGIAALGSKPNTTKPAPGHKIYPYLLRNTTIDRPNHVWADITLVADTCTGPPCPPSKYKSEGRTFEISKLAAFALEVATSARR